MFGINLSNLIHANLFAYKAKIFTELNVLEETALNRYVLQNSNDLKYDAIKDCFYG